jgi:hypothetical protein
MITIALLTGFALLTYLVYKISKLYKFYEGEDKELQIHLKRCK